MFQKILVSLIAAFCFAQESSATNYSTLNGNSPKLWYPSHGTRTFILIYAPSSYFASVASTDDIYDFVPTNGDWNAYNYTNTLLVYTYSQIAPKTFATADVTGFLTAVQNDPTLASVLPNLGTFLTQVSNDALSPTTMASDYSSLVSSAGLTWLTSGVQAKLLQYSAIYKVPLQ